MTLPDYLQPSCANINALSFASGAVSVLTGLDTLFLRFGAPPPVHWALGGVASDYYCKGALQPDQMTAMAAAAGFAGGYVTTMITMGMRS